MNQPDFNSEFYREIKEILEDDYAVSEQYSDAKNNSILIRPKGEYTPVYEGMIVRLNGLVDIFVYKLCDLSKIWKTFKVVAIDEDYKRVSQELEAKGVIEYKKYTVEYSKIFVLDNNCNLC